MQLDLEYMEEAREKGMVLKRAESLNDDPMFIQVIIPFTESK